jgi:hypothetical protein
MAQQITKTGVDFDTLTFTRVKQADGSFQYFESVTYAVLTSEEDFARSRTRGPLAGAVRTAVETRFNNAEAAIKTAEGIP